MSGLVKAKKYDWKDSNLALFGSDTEKQVKKESAECEPAWQGAGQEPGLQIWRIEKFEVKAWPKERYGEFFNGDSYIILNTYKEKDSDELLYDVHFWIGKSSTQDEYGTAAYKTVELDTYLDDKPVQHREVEKHESALFKSYFKTFQTLNGGCDSGFRTVIPETYESRLLHFHGEKGGHVEVCEIPMCASKLKETDVYILDQGQELHEYIGEQSSGFERNRAASYGADLRSSRGGKCKEFTVTESKYAFEKMLPREDDDDDDDEQDTDEPSLHRLSDGGTSSFSFEKVKDGPVSKGDFSSDDVFVFDTGKMAFVWVGCGASIDERRNGIPYAQKYLSSTAHPFIPITVIAEGRENNEFKMSVAA